MFGYISINKAEMKFKDFDLYQSFYCGLCKRLKEKYGKRGQISLSYDMTFLLVFLTGLYEQETDVGSCKCVAHPFEKHTTRINEITDYVADMNLLLTYYKCQDDWSDEKKRLKYLYGKMLEPKNAEIHQRYEKQAETMVRCLSAIHEGEQSGKVHMDQMAGYFGEIMGEIFRYKEDEWQEETYKVGFYLGKFIYLMDAYEDIEEDRKRGTYNPLLQYARQENFEEMSHQLLTMMMAECSRQFEKLPIIEYVDILRNVLYSGVWCRYEMIRAKRVEESQKEDGSI